jgi:hypothetical protein
MPLVLLLLSRLYHCQLRGVLAGEVIQLHRSKSAVLDMRAAKCSPVASLDSSRLALYLEPTVYRGVLGMACFIATFEDTVADGSHVVDGGS